MKRCYRCKQEKPLSEFYKKGDGVQDECKLCCREYQKTYREQNRVMIRDKHREVYGPRYRARHGSSKIHYKSKFGITLEELWEMIFAQDGVCAICENEPTERYPLVLDHCHATMKKRGVLCCVCNVGLGAFKDDPTLLNAAMIYLNTNA